MSASQATAPKPVINIDQLEFTMGRTHGDKFEGKVAPVAMRIGAKKLGYNVTKVPPGKRAFPFHSHHANEELFFILEGSGTLRYGAADYAVRKGDFIACPPGAAEVAHQLINNGADDLMYIAVSTTIETDVWSYPDSGKFGLVGGRQPGTGWPPKASYEPRFFRDGVGLDYWDGE